MCRTQLLLAALGTIHINHHHSTGCRARREPLSDGSPNWEGTPRVNNRQGPHPRTGRRVDPPGHGRARTAPARPAGSAAGLPTSASAWAPPAVSLNPPGPAASVARPASRSSRYRRTSSCAASADLPVAEPGPGQPRDVGVPVRSGIAEGLITPAQCRSHAVPVSDPPNSMLAGVTWNIASKSAPSSAPRRSPAISLHRLITCLCRVSASSGVQAIRGTAPRWSWSFGCWNDRVDQAKAVCLVPVYGVPREEQLLRPRRPDLHRQHAVGGIPSPRAAGWPNRASSEA